MKKLRSVARFAFITALLFPVLLIAQPVINSFSPAGGPIGTTVTIAGTGFSTLTADNIVFFGAVRAAVTNASSTSITVNVPAGATYLPISVTVNSLTAYSLKPFAVTFSGANSFSYGSFAPTAKFTTGLYPYGICMSDFDGDGKPDLAAPCYSNVPASFISVLKNTSVPGRLSFDTKIDVPIADMPYAIAAGDLDGDGKPDLAVTYISGGGNITIYKNTSSPGVIAFNAVASYATGSSPYRVLINDIDADGLPDLVVGNALNSSVSVFRNTSSGGVLSFAPKIDYLTALYTANICIADIDGDGKKDIAAACYQSQVISILKNTGSRGVIAFAPKTDITTGNYPSALTAGDVDGDGKADLVVGYYHNFSVLHNKSVAGAFSFDKVNYPLSSFASFPPDDIVLGDVDGDGKVDVIVAEDNAVLISKNNCTPGTVAFGAISPGYYLSPFKLAAGDLDGDGVPDIAATTSSGSVISVLRNKIREPYIFSFSPVEGEEGDTITITGFTFSNVNTVSFGGTPAASFTIENDNKIKAILAKGATGAVEVASNYGIDSKTGFTFHAPPVVSTFSPATGKTGDTIRISGTSFTGATAVTFGGMPAKYFKVESVNNITAVLGNGVSGYVAVATQYGKDSLPGFTWYPPPTITGFTPTAGGQGTVVTITGTNFNEISQVLVGGLPVAFTVQSPGTITVTIDEGATGSISITANGGTVISSTAFSFPPPVITSFSPETGMPGTTVTITGNNFRNDVNANHVYFGAVKGNVIAATRTSLAVEVPNGATYVPLTVTVNNHTAYASRPFNTSFQDGGAGITTGTFTWNNRYTTKDDIGRVQLSDLDGDGKPDVVWNRWASYVTAPDKRMIGVLRNTSTNGVVSFADAVSLVKAGNEMNIGDINGDGKPDVAVIREGEGIYIYRNTSSPGKISFTLADTITGSYYSIYSFLLNDFDGDAKTDMVVAANDLATGKYVLSFYLNTGYNGAVSFTKIVLPQATQVLKISPGDFNGDGKPDMLLSGLSNTVIVLRNVSVPGNISFTNDGNMNIGPWDNGVTVADFDNDGKSDLIGYDYNAAITIMKNVSNAGAIVFEAKTAGVLPKATRFIVGQLDGDGKPDLAILIDEKVLLMQNTSNGGTFSFASPVSFSSPVNYNWCTDACIGDIDGDGKPDMAISHNVNQWVSVLRNTHGEQNVTICSKTGTNFTSSANGANYQWQVNTGAGYANIADNANYSGVNTPSLKLSTVPASFNGSQYHCIVDGNVSAPVNLVVHPTIIPTGRISSSGTQVCTKDVIRLDCIDNKTPDNTWYELWQSNNGQAFFYHSRSLEPGYKYVTFDSGSVDKRYFFTLRPPESIPCSYTNNTDTVIVKYTRLDIPLITASGYTLSVSNADNAARYTWQIQDERTYAWSDITVAANGATYNVPVIGTYRVKATNPYCARYSDEKKIYVTGIDAVSAEAMGVRTYPNPVSAHFTIDDLKLSDKWQTLDVYASDGRQVVTGYNIRNQQTITLFTGNFVNGVYMVIMRRKEGAPVVMKFVKH